MLEEIPSRMDSRNPRDSFINSEGRGSEFQSSNSIRSKKTSFKRQTSQKINGKDKNDLQVQRGRNLIEKEKAEVGNVKWDVYKYYLKNVGFYMLSVIFGIQILTQGFEIASNAWLGQWSEDDKLLVDGKVNAAKRDMYLGIYGAMGIGQGKQRFET